ncbi:hypothetical protein TNCV_3915811 [Trichonephila clavipes]|nr:hypothetical protein TNCV_3915811 [Trichonephila clavipes]
MWVADHRDCIQSDWNHVLLVDESRFSLECNAGPVLVQQENGTRNNSIFVQERSHYRLGGLMVWNEISIGRRIDLLIIRNGNLTAQSYAYLL